jgi:HlyD family secretion protein
MRVKRKTVVTMVGGLVVLALGTGVGVLLSARPVHYVQGEIEATQIDISPKITGRIESILVKDGAVVTKGEPVVLLDSPETTAKLHQAEAARRAALASKKKTDEGNREEEIRQAKDRLAETKAQTKLLEKTYQRIRKLREQDAVATQQLDEAEANWRTALEKEKAAQAASDMATSGNRVEDREHSAALAVQAARTVDEVRSLAADLSLSSPIDGEVKEAVAKRGELVSPGYPVMTIIDLSDVWVTVNVREERLSKVRMGQVVLGRVPALGGAELPFVVNYISPLGDFATWRATSDSGDFDLKTFEVRAVPQKPVSGLRPGMSVLFNAEATS